MLTDFAKAIALCEGDFALLYLLQRSGDIAVHESLLQRVHGGVQISLRVANGLVDRARERRMVKNENSRQNANLFSQKKLRNSNLDFRSICNVRTKTANRLSQASRISR